MTDTLADLIGGTPGHAPATTLQKKVLRDFANDLRINAGLLNDYLQEVLGNTEATIDTITKRDASIAIGALQRRRQDWRATDD